MACTATRAASTSSALIATAINPVKVIDASALVAVVFVEPGCEQAAQRLQNGVLIAPDFLELEFTNVCVMKQRFNKATPAEVATLDQKLNTAFLSPIRR